MATGIQTHTRPYLNLLRGELSPDRLSKLQAPESWKPRQFLDVKFFMQAAFALDDFDYLTRSSERVGQFPDEVTLKPMVEEYTARIWNWIGHTDLALDISESRYFHTLGFARLQWAVTYAEALAGLGRVEEAHDILESNPPVARFQPRGRVRRFLFNTTFPKSLRQTLALEDATLACRHSLVSARVELGRGELEMARLLVRAASRMNVAPLYAPLLRNQCAYFLARCGEVSEAEWLLRKPLEHNQATFARDRWANATSSLLESGHSFPTIA